MIKSKKLLSQTTAEDIQDNIFKQMSADKKIEVGSMFWRLAKDLVGDKINYGKNRPTPSSSRDR